MWARYVEKGEHLVCLMQATDAGAGFLTADTRTPPSAASRWTGDLRSELAKWYWFDSAIDQEDECDFAKDGLQRAFEGHGLNPYPAYDDDGNPLPDGHNDCFFVKHENEDDIDDDDDSEGFAKKFQKYRADGKDYVATGAWYEFAINTADGAIVGKNIMSPSAAVLNPQFSWGRRADPEELPDLRFCSDIYWSYWVRNNPNIKNLRVYVAHHVINDNTVLLVSRAFRLRGLNALSVWPGTSFAAGTEAFNALVSSPIGATIAHLLIGHKRELGIRQITKITVVLHDPRPYYKFMNIFFTIEAVPEDQ
ncbi:hypothetical protein BDW02DRAFT_519446, partial [Decorospora gaudefroyi]